MLGLGVPSSAPGFRLSHIAAGPVTRFSGVAVGNDGGFLNLLNGQIGTKTGAVTTNTISCIGRGISENGSGRGNQFTGSAALDTNATLAGIGFVPTTGANIGFISNGTDGTTGGFWFGVSNAATWIVQTNLASPTFKTGGSARVANTPYFGAVSFNGSTTNFVAVNLATGQISTTTTGSAVTNSSGSNGSIYIGNSGNGSIHLSSSTLAAVMWSTAFLSPAQLLFWSKEPWGFWYPK